MSPEGLVDDGRKEADESDQRLLDLAIKGW